MRSFADIPAEVERRLDAGERVALVLLDAFGLRFLERHEAHPLVARLDVTPLVTQTPSTTTAHVPTLHFGVPVTEHGLYEWNVYEPSLDAVIVPFLHARSGEEPGSLFAEGFDVGALAPGPSHYRRLADRGLRSATLGPQRIAGSPFGAVALDGSSKHPFPDLAKGARELAALMRDPDGPHYATLYWDHIDATGHVHGPSSPEFDRAVVAALDALWEALRDLDGVTVLLTADHGQVDVSPDGVDYLDELWPELAGHLTQRHPAGSARDVFLHVDDPDTVIAELSRRLGDRARVLPAAELFDHVGERLAARLADVAVLPGPGREAWLRSATGVEAHFKGHHGGLDPAETATYLARLTA